MPSCLRPPNAFELDQYGDGDDLFYDDGIVWALCTVERGTLVVHEFRTLPAHRGRGHARHALEAMGSEYPVIVANGVEDDSPAEAFWTRMGEAGLVSGMRQYMKPDTTFRAASPSP